MSALEEWVKPMLLSRRQSLLARSQTSNSELSHREKQELQEIDAALARMLHGSYGHCEACDGQIGRQMLRARPEARRCTECETAENVRAHRSAPER